MQATRFRLTIQRLMLLIFALAIGGAILRVALIGSHHVSETAILAASVLVISLVPVIWPAGWGRAFPLGFALGGWTYLALSLGPQADPPEADYLPTATLLNIVHDRLYPAAFIREEARNQEDGTCSACVDQVRENCRRRFFRTGQAVTSVFVAAATAAIALASSACLDRLRLRNRTAAS